MFRRTSITLFIAAFLMTELAFVPEAFAQSNYMWQQQMRQQQMRQQEMMRQQQRQQEMMRQQRMQQEAMRRQQEQARQRQQEMARQRQVEMRRQTEIRRQQQAERQRQAQRQRELQRQRQREAQRTREIGQRQAASRQEAVRQRQAAMVQDRAVRQQKKLQQLRQRRLDEKRRQERTTRSRSSNSVAMIAALRAARVPTVSQRGINPVVRNSTTNTIAQRNAARQAQGSKPSTTDQLATQKQAAQAKIQRVRDAQRRLQIQRNAQQRQRQQQARQRQEQKTADAKKGFASCAGGTCKTADCSFHGDTLVLTKDGLKPIRSITPGLDYAWSRDETSGQADWKLVTAHFSNEYDEEVHVTVRNPGSQSEQTIVSNRIHRFFVPDQQPNGSLHLVAANDNHIPGAWVEAQHLSSDDDLIDADSRILDVSSVKIVEHPIIAYNITVSDYHTYFVSKTLRSGTIWVHNDCIDEVIAHKVRFVRITSKGTRIEEIPSATRADADADFDAMKLNKVRAVGPDRRMGFTSDNRRVIVRPSNKDGRPTIAIQNPNGKTIREVRYGDK